MTTESEFYNGNYTATYSAEDNKLRIYAAVRMDDETYRRAKELGFKWAPKQELFVAPMWTPSREDFCVELAGEITPEDTTLIERAENKAARLDNLATKRAKETDVYHRAANQISERFAYGQPILVGHHSERRARKDKAKMEAAMDKAIKAQFASKYWNYRAEGVERHANRKSAPGVRSRRIKTLLAELRDRQRDINHANYCLLLWESIKNKQDTDSFNDLVLNYAGARLSSGSAAPYYENSLYSQLEKGEISSIDAVEKCLSFHEYQSQNPHTYRWINHILNRLAFERSELGEVGRYSGEITPVILQAFARENGADSPKASKTERGYKVVSVVPLPLHIANGKELELSDEEWRDLMQSAGYVVPTAKPKAPPILNFKAASLKSKMYGNVNEYPQVEMTKEQYSKMYAGYKGIRLSLCGTFKFRTCMQQHCSLVSVFLVDSKAHDAPQSDAVKLVEEI